MDGDHDPKATAREWWASVFDKPKPKTEKPKTEEERRAETAAKAERLETLMREAGYDPDCFRPDWNATIDALVGCFYGRWRGILLRGGTGCGKTTLLRALRAVYQKHGTTFIDCFHAADCDWLDWPDAQRRLSEDRLILLDDLGTDEPFSVYGKRLDRIATLLLDWAEWPHRFPESRASLIVATNLTGDQVAARYGERVMSRLRDLRPVILRAPDMRGWQRFREAE